MEEELSQVAVGQGRFRDETLMELCVIGLTSKNQSGQPTVGGNKKVTVILAQASQCVGNSEELLMTWVAR